MPPDMATDVQVKNRENVKISPVQLSSPTVQSNCPVQLPSPTVQSNCPVQLSSPTVQSMFCTMPKFLGLYSKRLLFSISFLFNIKYIICHGC
jgi:hypothetical protein